MTEYQQLRRSIENAKRLVRELSGCVSMSESSDALDVEMELLAELRNIEQMVDGEVAA